MIRFQIEVCADIMTFTTDEPELIVRLYQGHVGGGGEDVIDIFEMPQFMDRLDIMREVYHTATHNEIVEPRHGRKTLNHHEAWHADHMPQDPWATYGYKE